jgi:hypothetical protein
MLTPPTGLKVFVATKPVDFRNYAESVIMQSPRGQMLGRRGVFVVLTQHNLLCVRPCPTSP